MYCEHCGAPLEVGAENCEYCGSPTPLGRATLGKVLERKKRERLCSMKRVSPGMLIFLCIVTLGLYSPIWYLRRRKVLKCLSPGKGLSAPLLWFYLVVSVAFFVIPQDVFHHVVPLLSQMQDNFFTIIFLLMLGLSIWLAFQTRRVFQTYASRFLEKKVVINAIVPSGLWLVLFGVIYLQLQVNKMIDMDLLNPEIAENDAQSNKIGR